MVTFGSRTKNVNRHWFVTFHNRGFPFLLGPVPPVPTKKNRGWLLQKIRKCCNQQFFCFCNLVRIWDKQNFSYMQKRMEMDWIYLFLIWCPAIGKKIGKKIYQFKILSYIEKQTKTTITKREGKEKKRREEKQVLLGIELGTSRTHYLPLCHVKHIAITF